MGKVIFEFDEEEERVTIENFIKRDNLKYALEKVKEYRRLLYKGYINNEIIVKDKKVIAEGTETYHPYYNLGNSKITNLRVSEGTREYTRIKFLEYIRNFI